MGKRWLGEDGVGEGVSRRQIGVDGVGSGQKAAGEKAGSDDDDADAEEVHCYSCGSVST